MRGGASKSFGDIEDNLRAAHGGMAVPQKELNIARKAFESATKNMSGGTNKSDYITVDDKFANFAMIACAIMAMIWFFVSRKLIKHKYNDAVCYSLLTLSLSISLLLLISFAFKKLKTSSEDGVFTRMLKGVGYIMKNGVPGFLILAQLILLIYIFIKHGEYLFVAQIPENLNNFNTAAAILILSQLWIWKKHLSKILHSPIDMISNNYYLLFGFVISSILSGLAISQIYIILDYLKTDC